MTLKKLKNGRWQVRWRDKVTKEQKAKNFRSREAAQEHLRALHRGEAGEETPKSSELSLGDVLAKWKAVRYPGMSAGTQVRYDNLARLYLKPLLHLRLSAVTPAAIDRWIEWMKDDPDRFGKGAIRTSFKHELMLLRTVLSFHLDYHDDDFVMPLKRRHNLAVRLRNRPKARPKDLSEADFRKFRDKLEADFGLEIGVMATLQFYDALRISEAAALTWEGVHFDWKEPRRSRLTFSEHVIYARSKDVPDFIEPGAKNSETSKEHPMLPEVFEALGRLWKPGSRGLVMKAPVGERGFFSYRQVQYRYNATFERLGLPYRSTHVMRHGGTRKTFDETGGDAGIAAQQLGNRDRKTVEVYAKRSVHAFTRYSDGQWAQAEARASDVHSAERRLEIVKDNN